MRGESGINFTGLYICSAIAFVMLVLKLSVIDTWSWWRVLLPLGLFVGFNVTNIVVAFIYLSFAHIPERPDGDEADILEPVHGELILKPLREADRVLGSESANGT